MFPLPPGTDFTRVIGRALRGNCPFAAPAAAGGGGAAAPARDIVKPVLSKIRISPKRFLAGRKLRRGTRKRRAVGARLTYTLSEPAAVTVRIESLVKGRRKGKRCVTGKRRPKKGRRCTRVIRRGTLSQAGKKGANRLTITGMVRRKRLKAGPYRLSIRARDIAGNLSATRRITFAIRRLP